MASNRQAHGNLFEERVAAYISIEMYKGYLLARGNSRILNAAHPESNKPFKYISFDWYKSQSQGMTDTYVL